jgi:hypothetical protein
MREVAARELLVQKRVVGVARSRVLHLAVERRRVAQHRRDAILRKRLRHRQRRLQQQHRPRLEVDALADEVEYDLALPHLRRPHEHHRRHARIAERDHGLALIRRAATRVLADSADASLERYRKLSAHSRTVMRGGGWNVERMTVVRQLRRAQPPTAVQAALRSRSWSPRRSRRPSRRTRGAARPRSDRAAAPRPRPSSRAARRRYSGRAP